MIDDVVVAFVNAPAVLTLPESGSEIFCGDDRGYNIHRPTFFAAFQSAEVNFLCGIRAIRFVGAIQTIARVTGFFRFRFFPEMFQSAKRCDGFAWHRHNVPEPVDVVTGFRQQHARRFGGVAPVPAHKRVGLMPIADRFKMLHAHHIADDARFNQCLEAACVGRVAHHMANGKHHTGAFHRRDDAFAIFRVRCHRFFQQDVIAKFGKCNRRLRVHRILRGNQHGIG